MNLRELVRIKRNSAFLWTVIIPVFIAAIYYVFIATAGYVSESQLIIKQTGESNSGTFSLDLFADALYLKEYIHSLDMLDILDKQFKLRQSYRRKGLDVISALSSDASREDFLDYYRKHVEVNFDQSSPVITLRVQAFSPELAQQLNQAIVEQSERFINAISHKIAGEQMLFIEQELAKTKSRLQESKGKMLRFQDVHNVLDPVEQAKAMAGFVTQMETSLAAHEAEILNLLTYLQEDSYQVITLKNKIGSLRQQIAAEKGKIASGGNNRLNEIAAKFQDIRLDVEFITDVYKITLAAMEKTRVEASKKLKNLIVIASPNLPEEAEYPRRAYMLAAIFLVLMLIYGIASLAVATIKEHRL
jgi:capsular polysaccharide transport system permease protein